MSFIYSFMKKAPVPVHLTGNEPDLESGPAEIDADSAAAGRSWSLAEHLPAWAPGALPSDEEVAAGNGSSALNLSYFERLTLFIVSIIGSFACYALCLALFPVLALKPKKFALIWTLGSMLFLLAFALLNGFGQFASHLVSKDRILFTVSYFASIALTIFFSCFYKSNIFAIVACIAQVIASIYYTVSYAPYGRDGLRFTTSVARSQVENWMST